MMKNKMIPGFSVHWKKFCAKKRDFGKYVVNLTYLMMYAHFLWMCFLSKGQTSNTIFTEFTHDFKWIYLTILGLTIWKAKSEWILKKAHEWKVICVFRILPAGACALPGPALPE